LSTEKRWTLCTLSTQWHGKVEAEPRQQSHYDHYRGFRQWWWLLWWPQLQIKVPRIWTSEGYV